MKSFEGYDQAILCWSSNPFEFYEETSEAIQMPSHSRPLPASPYTFLLLTHPPINLEKQLLQTMGPHGFAASSCTQIAPLILKCRTDMKVKLRASLAVAGINCEAESALLAALAAIQTWMVEKLFWHHELWYCSLDRDSQTDTCHPLYMNFCPGISSTNEISASSSQEAACIRSFPFRNPTTPSYWDNVHRKQFPRSVPKESLRSKETYSILGEEKPKIANQLTSWKLAPQFIRQWLVTFSSQFHKTSKANEFTVIHRKKGHRDR